MPAPRFTQFEDRADAARCLADALAEFQGASNTIILGLCRGGVPVARILADTLDLPMDVIVVRKLSLPGNPEFAIGAVSEHGALVLNTEVLKWLAHADSAVAAGLERASRELNARILTYRGSAPPLSLADKTVILADDGAATGSTMKAALQAARKAGARKLVAALPLAPPETREDLALEADKVVCVWEPVPFHSVGAYYRSFPQISDSQVKELLGKTHLNRESLSP